MLADTAILAFWIITVWALDTYVLQPVGTFVGLDALILEYLKFVLGVPVIIGAACFTVADISGALRSTVEAIRDQWGE